MANNQETKQAAGESAQTGATVAATTGNPWAGAAAGAGMFIFKTMLQNRLKKQEAARRRLMEMEAAENAARERAVMAERQGLMNMQQVQAQNQSAQQGALGNLIGAFGRALG